ncbi:UDP-N-acetylmuramoyl-L-alanyl-D-glutamate--2,6-diaminopimelate ligase [Nitrosovibrio tenuis]|uniref:UDP-N-acetylmuramoyl-L-alanyl-D-glutamate--2,6-diaminopimelate ligase n=1 Tax=Nitrosovibrio tenuis TaxID=1233 RepID=A0A1H7FZB7_9PROT|nr:UDP-N-acetylmuramoyl-L-alanyl-D-glutamate--2,6-diaminopimelate ligase [Nitrosovibrio tenuis]SEK31396.1 UDP-N-acetylmuramoylalanyl-D-glutamate--2,6-diaminopimelate ligase [Nitrosovibrio tenuis]
MSARSDIGNSKLPAYPAFDFRVLDNLGVRITNIVADSRMVTTGDTFLAYGGEKSDGRNFIPQAIAAGANGILWDPRGFPWDSAWRVPNLPIARLRAKAGVIADHVYGHPSQKLWLIGITGTNGKTSCSHWIAQAMTALGRKTAIIGTLGIGFPGELASTASTTPDAVLLQRKLAELFRLGACGAAMEVSSHGIVQERINGTTFSVALLTNLSRDHLDYHGSMETYAAAKARLFRWPGLKHAVLNLDDAFGAGLLKQIEGADASIIGYGFAELRDRMLGYEKFKVMRGRNLKSSSQGVSFDAEFESEHFKVESKVIGRFNASNLLGVLATLVASGVRLADAVQVLHELTPVPGRMEQLGAGDLPLIVIDYAHTPDALEKVLATAREILHGGSQAGEAGDRNSRLICVFGCGGERDQGKRPIMGAVATRLADEVIITSDNPRKEDPNVIISEIAAGAGVNHVIEEDRAAAICRAIQDARKGDAIVIAGKGHEAYQEIDGQKRPFSDRDVARRALMARIPA